LLVTQRAKALGIAHADAAPNPAGHGAGSSDSAAVPCVLAQVQPCRISYRWLGSQAARAAILKCSALAAVPAAI